MAALARLATASSRIVERDLYDTIASLKAQALRYETALDNISQGVCFFDGEQRLILCNRRYAEIYRLAPDQIRPGATLRQITESRSVAGTSSMSVDDYLSWCASVISHRESRTWTAELKDGRTIHVCHQPMPDGGWVATHEDITELKAMRTVADERISLQALIDWLPDNLWVKDVESRFVISNKVTATRMGLAEPAALIGKSDLELLPREIAQKFYADEQKIIRSGQP
ncbi:MAG: PAS-domain containing protein, partial [Roseiarcus sp.]